MNTDPLRERGTYVEALASAVASGAGGLQHVPGLLRRVLDNDGWTEFVTTRGDHRAPRSFSEFVTTPPLSGIGAESVAQLKRLVGNDNTVLDLIDRAEQRPTGRPRTAKTLDNVKGFPAGNARDAALRRLRKDAPDLHAAVLADEISPHAAMVQAGFRPKTVTIRLDRPDRAAAALRRHLSADELHQLIQLLQAEAL